MWIAFRDFHGLVPKARDPRELPPGYAQVANNCFLEGGSIRPVKGLVAAYTPSKPGTKQTIHLYKDTSPDVLFHWLEDVDIVQSIIDGDATGLAIFTGVNYPRITNAAFAVSGGGTTYPNVSYRLGVPQPVSAPTVTVLGDPPPSASDEPIEDVSYRYCFVCKAFSYDQKGPLSTASEVVSASFTYGQSVRLDNLATSPGTGNYNTTGMVKQIYRGAAGVSVASWVLVAEIPLAQTSYTDTTPEASLSLTAADNEDFYPPPDGMIGIKMLPNEFAVGHYRNTIYPTEPGQPHAFPTGYYKSVDWRIVGIGALGQGAVVVTQGQPYMLLGSHPSNISLTKLSISHPGRSKRGIVEMDDRVLYPATMGIAEVTLSDAGLSTEGLLDKTSWAQYGPSTINGYTYNDWYIGFYTYGQTQAGFMFHPRLKEFVTIDAHATAGYEDRLNGNLYLQIGDVTYRWDIDSTYPLTLTYKTRPERVPYPCCMGYGMVLAREYPVTYKLYGDGVLKKTITVENGNPFPIKGGYIAREYEIEVSGTNEIIWFGAGESIEDVWEALASGRT